MCVYALFPKISVFHFGGRAREETTYGTSDALVEFKCSSYAPRYLKRAHQEKMSIAALRTCHTLTVAIKSTFKLILIT